MHKNYMRSKLVLTKVMSLMIFLSGNGPIFCNDKAITDSLQNVS